MNDDTDLKRRVIVLESQIQILKEIVCQAINAGHPAPRVEAHHGLLEKLTLKQAAVLQLVVEGCTNEQIAETLECSTSTAKTHVRSLVEKVGGKNRADLILAAKMELETVGDKYEKLTGLPLEWWKRPDDYARVTALIRQHTR